MEPTGEAERYATEIRHVLDCVTWTPSIEDLVCRALGRHALRKGPIAAAATRATVNGSTIFYMSTRVAPARARWALAHAFAVWALEHDGFSSDDAQRLRSRLAAEFLLPSDAARRVFPKASPSAVASRLVMPVAASYLREAELLRVPTCLVALGRDGLYARTRGDDDGRLPVDLDALRLLASQRSIGVTRTKTEDGGTIIRLASLPSRRTPVRQWPCLGRASYPADRSGRSLSPWAAPACSPASRP